VALQPDGKIVVFGRTWLAEKWKLVRFDTNGVLDPTFGTGGTVELSPGLADNYALAVTVDASGRLIVTGGTTTSDTGAMAVARLSSAGALDPTFGLGGYLSIPSGPGARPQAHACGVVFAPDAGMFVAGGAYFGTAEYISNEPFVTDTSIRTELTLLRLLP
jgi:uncharacterized delta-60 repeat protein